MAYSAAIVASEGDQLEKLVAKAGENNSAKLSYSGDLSPSESFEYIKNNPGVVVDVRTVPEWQFVGVPDLAGTQGKLMTLSWKSYPSFAQNQNFLVELDKEIGASKDIPLFFLCRSGGRSLDAAVAATAAGYKYCFNIAGGFEGDTNTSGHRGSTSGWKHDNLPWVQG